MRTITRLYEDYDVARNVVTLLEAEHVPFDDISLVTPAREGATTGTTAGLFDSTSPTDVGTRGDRVGGHDAARAGANAPGTPEPEGTKAKSTGPGLTGTGSADATRIGHVPDSAAGHPDPAEPTQSRDTDREEGVKQGAVAGSVLGGGIGLLAGIGALAIPGVGPVVAAGWLVATLAGAGVGAGAGGLVGALTGVGLSPDEANVYEDGVRRGGSWISVRVPDAREAEVAALMDQHNPVDWQARRTSHEPAWRAAEQGGEAVAEPATGSGSTDEGTDARAPTDRPTDAPVGRPGGAELEERIAAAEKRLMETNRVAGRPGAIPDERQDSNRPDPADETGPSTAPRHRDMA